MIQCVFSRNGQRCPKEGTITAGFSDVLWHEPWKVCAEHRSWFSPARMPRWYWYTSGPTIALILAGILIFIAQRMGI